MTTFEYGPFGVIEKVIDPYGHQTSMEYDELGRRFKLTDPDTGVKKTYFDAFGAPTEITDGNGQSTTFRYDVLGRLYTMSNPSGTTIYVWDSSANGVGMLSQTQSPDGVNTAYSYDAHSRLAIEGWSVQGQFFSVLRDYDQYGRLELVTYPGAAVKYVYNDRGFVEEIRQPGQNGRLYWKANERNAAGSITQETFGNGLTTRRSYDIENRLKYVETSKPAPLLVGTVQPTLLQVLAYDYDTKRGLLSSRHDVVSKTTEDFEYDFLERLTKWTVYQDCCRSVMTYGYDDIGNLLNRTVIEGLGTSVVNSYVGPNGGPHAIKTSTSSVQVASYGYDTAGRQVNGPNRTVDYTFFDLPSHIDSSNLKIDFKYDALNQRVIKKESNGNEILYVGDAFERRTTANGVSFVYNIFGPDRQVAQLIRTPVNVLFTREDVYFLHDDRLGSTDAVTDASGTVVERVKYEPFGDRRNPASIASSTTIPHGVIHKGFTGHEPDDEFGLINMTGRIYDSGSGRFLTADPIVSALKFSQSNNRYSYALNSPLTFVDPTGFEEGTVEQRYEDKSIFSFDIHNLALRIAHWFSEDDYPKHSSQTVSAATTGHADKQGSQSGDIGKQTTNNPDMSTPNTSSTERPRDVGQLLDLPWDRQMHLLKQDADLGKGFTWNGSMSYENLLDLEARNTEAIAWESFNGITLGLLGVRGPGTQVISQLSTRSTQAVVTVEQSVARGLVPAGGRLHTLLSNIQRIFSRVRPTDLGEAQAVLDEALQASNLRLPANPAAMRQLEQGFIEFQSAGGEITRLTSEGEIIVTKGTDVLLRLAR